VASTTIGTDRIYAVPAQPIRPLRPGIGRDALMMRATLVVVALVLLVVLVLPLYTMLSKSVEDRSGAFVGLANYAGYFATPALFNSIYNSLTVSLVSAAITVSLAFVFAYGLTRSCMPGKAFFRGAALVPILAPSLLPGISLVYLFGNKGMIREVLMGEPIYGPLGIIIGEVFFCFPHAVLILTTALSLSDARLYEATESLGAGKLRQFLTVTLPGARYGLVSAGFVVFTLVITDFGVPKVIGGQFNVLATDVYKQVVGQANFQMGAVVSVVLLLPAIFAFIADRVVQRRQVALLSARAVPLEPKPSPPRDRALLLFCSVVAIIILGILGVAALASFIKLWPYDLSLSLKNYQFQYMDGGGWNAYWNSLELAAWTALIGSAIVFIGAYVTEKTRGAWPLRTAVHFLAMLPMAVPGMVLGLAYIFFFNSPANPLGFIYHTMAILVISTIVHFYTVCHLTAVTALKQLDAEFETVSLSLKVPLYKTFWRVTVPVCLPAILDIGVYFFLNAMTTVSAVVFLYSVDTALASVAVLNMDDAGDIAPAAAMAMMIVYTSAALRLLHGLATRGIARRTQAWRRW
jgi:iron(III) transport system permease protein